MLAWKVTIWLKRKKFKKPRNKVWWGRGPCEGKEESPPTPNPHLASLCPQGTSSSQASWCFPISPRPGPWPQTCSEWCLSWKHLCRCYSDNTLILSPPLLPLNLSTSNQGFGVFVCLCVCGRGVGWRTEELNNQQIQALVSRGGLLQWNGCLVPATGARLRLKREVSLSGLWKHNTRRRLEWSTAVNAPNFFL